MEKQYGISNQNQVYSAFDLHIEEFTHQGYTIIDNVIQDSELEVLRKELQNIYSSQEDKITKDAIKKINEEFMARALLCYSESYLELASNEFILNYIKKILGNYFILHLQNGIINMPNEEHHQSSWHRDMPYQNWVCSEPLACNAFYCLDVFNNETGATYLLPYSHKMINMPSPEYVKKHAIQISAKPGSVILFDTMLFHKAGYNSSDQIRRGINHVYTKGFIRQQIDLPSMLQGKYSENSSLNILLGYDAETCRSVEEFRKRRLNKVI
jgi:ectoine hydroxylase-related dioxygenase (phytanoyl-CoA dioxygenase family)